MKTTLDHLPEHKQQELNWASDIITESVQVEMLILFGSYARGDWVEELADDGVHYQYQSDFDLLAVVKSESQGTKIERKDSLHKRLHREIKTPVSIIAEDIQFINRRLSKGQYFYTDILKEGILLFDSGELQLAEARELNQQERIKLAREDFEYWLTNAQEFYCSYEDAKKRGHLNKSAFQLHQATECLYNTVLLVFTRYKPKSHDLLKLTQLVASIEPKFLPVFPQSTEAEKYRFELLRKAYIDARYKPSYTITSDELEWLAERAQYLKKLTETLCQEKISSFDA